MSRLIATFVVALVLASACGGGGDPAPQAGPAQPTTTDANDTELGADLGPTAIDQAAAEVAAIMVEYHDSSTPGSPAPIIEIVESALTSIADRHRGFSQRFPDTFGEDDLDVALDELRQAMNDVADSADRRSEEIERDREALVADLEESQAILPQLEGSELGRVVARLEPSYLGVAQACQGLQRLLVGQTEELIDCVGSSLLSPPGQIEAPVEQEVVVGDLTVRFGMVDYPARPADNGVELGEVSESCAWIGRPTAVTDGDLGHTSPVFAEPGQALPLNHEAPVPVDLDGLIRWLETPGMQEMVEVAAIDLPEPEGSPFGGSITAFFRDDGAFPIVFIASEPELGVGCDQLGWGQAVRLRVADIGGSPAVMITTVSSGGIEIDREHVLAQLDAADQRFVGTFELIAGS